MIRKQSLLTVLCLLAMLASLSVFAAKTTPPIVGSPTIGSLTGTSAVLGGTVTDIGTDPVDAVGIEWSTVSGGPYTSQAGTYPGLNNPFIVNLSALSSGITYYWRAWATNTGNGTNRGDTGEQLFTTPSAGGPPTLSSSTLDALANVSASSATLGGDVDTDGGGGDGVDERGIVWNTSSPPESGGTSVLIGSGLGPFSQLVSGLVDNGKHFYFRSYASNVQGTAYGPINSLYTEPNTSPASATIDNVGDTSFRINWPANPAGDGDGTIVVMRLGAPDPGIQAPADGDDYAANADYTLAPQIAASGNFVVYRGTGATSVSVTGLTDTTAYNVAVYYSAGTGTGETGINYRQTSPATASQTTNSPAVAPTLSSTPTYASVTATTAVLGGTMTSDGGAPVVCGVEWDNDVPGAPYANSQTWDGDPATCTADVPFVASVINLPPGDTIYFRAYATNSAGTGYSSEVNFPTPADLPTVDTATVADITATIATLGGRVFSDGGDAITQRGTVWGTTPDPDIVAQAVNVNIVAGTTGIFSGPVIDLPTGTLVYYRAYATNSAGTAYSASDSFTPSEPPIMGDPTLGALNYFSAELGGIITSDGGNPILSRGTVWNTTGSPVIETDNPLAAVGTAVSEAFSHTRFLTAGDNVFYRAYATSVVGTGYSTQGSFTVPTQPDVPATLVTFRRIAANSLKISWTPGNGEGRIVVLRLTGNGITAPQDGDDYTASPDLALAPELPVNSQNFVVYKGSHSVVVVTGLTINTSYSVAVYEYAGSGATIDYLQLLPAEGTQSTNDIPVHNLDHDIDCNECHSHGTYSTYVPQDGELKTVCENCHRIGGVAAAKLEFDLHLIPNSNPAIDFVDCGYCHEVHNPSVINTTESLHPIDLITRTNKSFLRANVDKYVATAASPAALHTDDPGHADPPNLALTPDRAVEGGTEGYCQVCHTLTKYHRNIDVAESNQCHDGEGGDEPCTIADPEINCGRCHQHNNKFIGVGGSQTCIDCHGGPQGSRPTITTQFDRASTHITSGSTAVTQPDCAVCHDQGSHTSGTVRGWDADTYSSSFAQPNPNASTLADGEGEAYAGNCMSCHDDGSADGLAGGDPDQTPTSPFIGSGAPPVIPDIATATEGGWDLAGHNRPLGTFPSSPVSCIGDGTNGCHASGHGTESVSLLANAQSPTIPAEGPAVNPTDFCFECHDGAPSTLNIQLQFGNPIPDTSKQTTSNSGALVNQRHDIYTDDQLYSGGSVSCKDCHSPHVDNTGNPVSDPDTGLLLETYSPANSYTDDGNNFAYDAGGNQNPTNPEGGSGLVEEPDYIQFCLTCHDGTTPAGVTMSANMLDIASSYGGKQHGGGEGSSGSKTGKGSLKVPWTTSADFAAGNDPSAPYAALNCTLCHGAHGSPSIFNLRESINVAGTQMMVGNPSGSEFDFITPSTTYTLPANGGTQADHVYGAWCTFCHNMSAHAGVDETTTCTSAHMHGSNSF